MGSEREVELALIMVGGFLLSQARCSFATCKIWKIFNKTVFLPDSQIPSAWEQSYRPQRSLLHVLNRGRCQTYIQSGEQWIEGQKGVLGWGGGVQSDSGKTCCRKGSPDHRTSLYTQTQPEDCVKHWKIMKKFNGLKTSSRSHDAVGLIAQHMVTTCSVYCKKWESGEIFGS